MFASLKTLFSRPEPKPELTVEEALENAVDEVNRLVALQRQVDPGSRIRPWVRTGTRSTRRPLLCLGYWDSHNEEFVVTYEGEA